ncbi:MAG: hypothetical protein NWE89_01600 [Candidatus Bathyarchaeota archaeon]|nr:hypothetical protein [Candidatus Bathyarchaeota archaeon]
MIGVDGLKRYTHAWIATRAIDRLGSIGKQFLEKEEAKAVKKEIKAAKAGTVSEEQSFLDDAEEIRKKAWEKYGSILFYWDILKSKIELVVEGAWLPDNVIGDMNPGHIWKYRPPMVKGEEWKYDRSGIPYTGVVVKDGDGKKFYRVDHAETLSLCYQEAEYAYAWNKAWDKVSGRLADRVVAVQQMMRDLILYQRDEMHRITATLMAKFDDDLFSKVDDVKAFLSNRDEVNAYYDEKVNEEYVNRKKIIDIRNKRNRKEYKFRFTRCLMTYGDLIKKHLYEFNSDQVLKGKQVYFPMFFSDDQIALTFFTLSHYVADAHMPLHCDAREFSDDDCDDIHGLIEKEWEDWVIKSSVSDKFSKSLSESTRTKKFIEHVFKKKPPLWRNYVYPDESALKLLDDKLGEDIWESRKGRIYDGDYWNEIVGVTYASYCLASRLLEFSDKVRAVPKTRKDQYNDNFDGNVLEIDKENWMNAVKYDCAEERFGKTRSSTQRELIKMRKKVFDLVEGDKDHEAAFKYLSLLVLIDAIECVAKMWAETILDHLKYAYGRPRKA